MNLTFDNNDLTEMVQKKVADMGFDGKTITVKFGAKKGAGAEATVTVSEAESEAQVSAEEAEQIEQVEHLFTVRVPYPTYERKTKSNVLCSINTIPQWYRWAGSKIKKQFKQDLEEMYIPAPKQKYESLTIHYRIIRDSKRRIDADSAA